MTWRPSRGMIKKIGASLVKSDGVFADARAAAQVMLRNQASIYARVVEIDPATGDAVAEELDAKRRHFTVPCATVQALGLTVGSLIETRPGSRAVRRADTRCVYVRPERKAAA